MNGPFKLAGILLTDGAVWLQGPAGARHMVALDDIWRNDKLLEGLSPSDAFRVGAEWQRWNARRLACQ